MMEYKTMPYFILNLSYRKLCLYTLFGALVVTCLIFLMQNHFNKTIANVLTNVLVALSASIIVSFFWNKLVLDATNHFEKSGIKDYFSNFSLVEPKIRERLEISTKIELFFMHGKTFINSNSSSIQKALGKRGNEIVIIIADENNPFLQNYSNLWGYDNEKIKTYINETFNDIIGWYNNIPSEQQAKLEIYKFTKGCFTYSYYKLDDDFYFVPNKLVSEKTFKPVTIYGSKTKVDDCLYNRLSKEKAHMISNGELIKIYPLDLE